MNEEKVNKCLWDDYRMNAKERWCARNLVKGGQRLSISTGSFKAPVTPTFFPSQSGREHKKSRISHKYVKIVSYSEKIVSLRRLKLLQ